MSTWFLEQIVNLFLRTMPDWNNLSTGAIHYGSLDRFKLKLFKRK